MPTHLLFFLLVFQNQPFYELYKDGRKALEEKKYQEAVVFLTDAVRLKPESKKNAKTYGVQFIEYYPYHHLALAYYKLGEFENAKNALNKAYSYAENQEYSIRATMELLNEQLSEISERKAASTETFTIDTTKVTKLLGEEKLEQAYNELNSLQKKFPTAQVLIDLRNLFNFQVARKQELESARAERDKKILEFLGKAKKAEGDGLLEESLVNYQTVLILDESNQQATLAIPRLKSKLEAEGRTAQDIEKSINERLENNQTELTDAYSKIEKLTNELLEAQERLLEFQNRTPQVPTNIDVKFDVIPVEADDYRAHFNIHIIANQGLQDASLFINGDFISTWQIHGRKEFRTPFYDNYKFSQNRNVFQMKVTDLKGETFYDFHNHTFPIQMPSKDGIRNSQILLAFVTMVLILFFIKKRKSSLAFRNRFNPYIAGAPVLNENMFYGRRPLLRQILNTIHNNSIMIFGERRIGKTSFLHQLNSVLPELDDPQFEFIPVLIDLQGVTENQFFSVLDQEISHGLETKGIQREPGPVNLDARIFTQRLREGINDLRKVCPKAPKLVLLLDEVDIMNEFSEKTNQQLRSVFMKSFSKYLVAVMAGININTTWKSQGSPWYNFFEQIELKPFPKNLAAELISNPVKGVYNFDKEARQLIIELSLGKPYLIQKLCLNLVAHVLKENRRKVTTKDVRYVYQEIKNEVWTGA